MSGAVENTQKSRRRAARAAQWLTAACEPLEHRRLLSGYGPLVPVASFVPFPNGENPQAAVTFDASGNLWGTTKGGGANGDGTVFEIAKGSSTITTVASFNEANGRQPLAAVTFDTSGNLWGTTEYGGASGGGEVFEIAKGGRTITTVASFNAISGEYPFAPVTFDANGNLWGTTEYGGANGEGTVFEIANGSGSLTTVASFTGGVSQAGVTFDVSGNLWGTTVTGGANSAGAVFEIARGSSSIITVASFNRTNGREPFAGVTFDASGNLWGTTYYGGASDYGTVFEIAKGSSTITAVGSFNSSSGQYPIAAVTFDASGNLWGTTEYGGPAVGVYGTVFEIAKGTSKITTVAGFNASNGGELHAEVTFDSGGNLWGTTNNGGVSGNGTVFKIAKGASTITSVASFNATSGANPDAAVTFDTSGNLWGTTSTGGPSNSGTVFKIAAGSTTVTTLASFNGSNGTSPVAGVTLDASGNLWGTTQYGGTSYSGGFSGFGTVFEIAKGSTAITTVALKGNTVFPVSGYQPEAGVTFDSSGNLWGTTVNGGSNIEGTVFEIAKGSGTVTDVASFNPFTSSSEQPFASVEFDSSGNLWGTTKYGNGLYSNGTVFEVAKGSATITTVASFNGSTGPYVYSVAAVTFDVNSNLWGTTANGGESGNGSVFEIAHGSGTISTVASFNGSNGANPLSSVTFDASGNLWGTTAAGGISNKGTVFEIAKGSSTISTIASFNGSNGNGPRASVTFDANGNLWGTTDSGGAANAGVIWELPLQPIWLSDPTGNDTWNTASHTLTVNDPTTLIADPGSDQPIIQANGSSAVITINPSSALQIHLGGLSLTNGASVILTSLGAARTATNHRLLVLGQPGATSAPMFTIDAASKLDLTDNDLVDHDGSLSSVAGFLISGSTGGWTGDGIVSSKAGGSAIYTLGIGQSAAAGTFDAETVGTSDVELRYTYFGDANLDGRVDGSDYSKIDFGFLNHMAGWSNGDFNYDGVINGSDYTLIDNAFNTQGAALAASIAPPKTSIATDVRSPSATHTAAPVSKGGAVRPIIGGKTIGRSRTASFAPDIFSAETLIALTESTEQSIELSIPRRDLLDQLSFAQ